MRAGLDVGYVFTKAAWHADKQTRFLSTADLTHAELFEQLEQAGVTELVVTGRGRVDIPALFEVTVGDSPVAAVGRGIRAVLPAIGLDPLAFLVVDIGASTRYALYLKHTDRTTEMPFELGLGGGYLQGSANLLALDSVTEMGRLALNGAAPDILAKDINSEMGGTVGGEEPLVHFGWAEPGTPMEDICAGHFQAVACAIQRDLKFHRMMLRSLSANDSPFLPLIMVVGTLPSRLEAVRASLKEHLTNQLFIPVFPPYGEYLTALGALDQPA